MSRSLRPRVLLADDHRMVAEGLKTLLSPEFELLALVEDGRALVESKKLDPQVKVVFLTMHQEVAYARRALEAGAAGFVLKHSAPAELVTAIRAALNNQTYLTPALAGRVLQDMKQDPDAAKDPAAALTMRQREILQLLAEGRSAKQTAAALGISARTVEFHRYQMMETLGLHSSAELVHFAIKQGIVAI